MPSLLIRDISEETKHALAIRAARNSRSQQAEANAILEEHLLIEEKPNLLELIRRHADKVGGIDIPMPERHKPRLTGILLDAE